MLLMGYEKMNEIIIIINYFFLLDAKKLMKKNRYYIQIDFCCQKFIIWFAFKNCPSFLRIVTICPLQVYIIKDNSFNLAKKEVDEKIDKNNGKRLLFSAYLTRKN